MQHSKVEFEIILHEISARNPTNPMSVARLTKIPENCQKDEIISAPWKELWLVVPLRFH
ncbi:hypothetical protein PITCH_A1870002 [uncultured Desulfobacterium sp.]|uniref:Uncharacterized protein n=1 Tax=uncultured Desulfobacterium sp. TaxID=201089 RepID=A0A445MVE7_9BACT|nr:hypothetical protein PITCH_A1870002 [uncultured Desulfobacterium sp.]